MGNLEYYGERDKMVIEEAGGADEKVNDTAGLLLLYYLNDNYKIGKADIMFKEDMSAYSAVKIFRSHSDKLMAETEEINMFFCDFYRTFGFSLGRNGVFFRFIFVCDNLTYFTENMKPTLEKIEKECENRRIMCEFDIIDVSERTYYNLSGGKVSERKTRKLFENVLSKKGPDIKKEPELKARKFHPLFNLSTLLIAVNILIFVFDYSLRMTGNFVFLDFGAQINGAVKEGEIHRLLTSMFLHADIAHISGNMITLFILGKIILKYYDSPSFSLIYFTGGLFGNLLSLIFLPSETVSLGASGAIMALGGALIYKMFFGKGGRKLRNTANCLAIALVIIYNLFYGLFQKETDNFAHFGGFLAGFSICLFLEFTNKKERKNKNDG